MIAEAPLFAPHSGAVSASGTPAGDLAFALASGEGSGRLTWLDRRGESLGTIGTEPMLIRGLAPARDGNRYAVQVATATGGNLWVGDERRRVTDRLTPEGTDAQFPVWAPEADRIAFMTEASGKEAVWVQAADGGRAAEILVGEAGRHFRPKGWSADGRWLAYTSDESGNPEVFVRPFPALDRKWKISQGGGYHPHWRGDGRELRCVAIAHHGVNAVAIATASGDLEAGVPQPLVAPRSPLLALAPAPDHSRFLAGVVPGDVRSEPIHLVLGWRAARGEGAQ